MRYKELADAIRRGAKIVSDGNVWLVNGKGCALGAALASAGYTKVLTSDRVYSLIRERFKVETQIINEVFRMHNSRRFTREQIADWLDSLEEPRESDSDWAKRKVAEVTRVKEAA